MKREKDLLKGVAIKSLVIGHINYEGQKAGIALYAEPLAGDHIVDQYSLPEKAKFNKLPNRTSSRLCSPMGQTVRVGLDGSSIDLEIRNIDQSLYFKAVKGDLKKSEDLVKSRWWLLIKIFNNVITGYRLLEGEIIWAHYIRKGDKSERVKTSSFFKEEPRPIQELINYKKPKGRRKERGEHNRNRMSFRTPNVSLYPIEGKKGVHERIPSMVEEIVKAIKKGKV